MLLSKSVKTSLLTHVEHLCKNHFTRHRFSSVVNSPLSKTELSSNTHGKEDGQENSISLYTHKKYIQKKTRPKVKRSPFMKNLFIGKFDKDVLAFPEIHDNEEIAALDKMADQVRRYIIANVDSDTVDKTKKFPQTVMENLKRMGLLGTRLPMECGGLGLTATEHVRLMEAAAVDSALLALLNTHHGSAEQGVMSGGSDHLRNTFLPKLATGELSSTTAILEQRNEYDLSSIQTVLTQNRAESNMFNLSGKKTWVVNAKNSDLFIVLAKDLDPERPDSTRERYTAVLVEKTSPGIVICEDNDKLGLCGANMCSVEFHETPVPFTNVIGQREAGHAAVLKIMMQNRFHIGAFTSGLAKALSELATDHCINTNLFLKPLREYEMSQIAVGEIVQKAYAMESVTYLTAGLFDSTEDPDLFLEYSAVKVFCTEGLWYCANKLLGLIGPKACISGHPVERTIRDSRMWLMLEGTNDQILQFITLASLDYMKDALAEDVEKLRNPLFHPSFSIAKRIQDFNVERKKYKLTMDLQGYLHPSLQQAANYMEYSVQRLKHSLEVCLQRFGPEIWKSEANLCRLADMAIEIYVMAAVCSRASRAYCIGLPSAETEVFLALAYCQDGYQKMDRLHTEIYQGISVTTDDYLGRISAEMFQKQGYCLVPPFTRTY